MIGGVVRRTAVAAPAGELSAEPVEQALQPLVIVDGNDRPRVGQIGEARQATAAVDGVDVQVRRAAPWLLPPRATVSKAVVTPEAGPPTIARLPRVGAQPMATRAW